MIMNINHLNGMVPAHRPAASFGRKLTSALMAIFILAVPSMAEASHEADLAEKTASPYFFLPDGNPAIDALPLASTEVDARIVGVIADVTVTQVYKNAGQRPIEAQYVFPASTRAAVHAMTVRVENRIITAEIREKEQAKQEYEQAKSEGKTAALLEEHRPNVFQMNVANILPGEEVQVELRYTELLRPESGRYQFVFPSVVGPRYNSPRASHNSSRANDDNARASDDHDDKDDASGNDWVEQAYLFEEAAVRPPAFNLQVRLDTPIAIKDLRSPSHEIEISRTNDRRATVRLGQDRSENGDKRADDRDFILDYQLAGAAIESGVMIARGPEADGENFFLAMIEPPKATPPEVVTPREYIFVVDVSGSMHGFPLDTAKSMVRELIGGLRPSDTFNVLLFSGSSRFMSERSVPATRKNIVHALRLIDGESGGGGTELIPALRKVYAQDAAADISRSIVVITDGFVVVEDEAFRLVRGHLDQANLFAFGIGSSVNRHLIEGLARAGMGEAFVITNSHDAPAQAKRFRQMIESPVLTHIKLGFEGIKVHDMTPESVPDVLGERPVILFGKWRDSPAAQARRLIIDGQSARGAYHATLPLTEAAASLNDEGMRFSALRQLWARQKISDLGDRENMDGNILRQEIVQVGLEYGLLSRYTSFIAVDQVVRADGDGTVTVKQPLPLPSGVGPLAVGGGTYVPGTPEPAPIGALLVALSMLAMIARRRQRQRNHRMTS
ncbi:MAG: VIT and VWA domain-containing protein [Azoarcus sp.]|nr:VIT and VWA domain-containing protein [Azoarcus sp.]